MFSQRENQSAIVGRPFCDPVPRVLDQGVSAKQVAPEALQTLSLLCSLQLNTCSSSLKGLAAQIRPMSDLHLPCDSPSLRNTGVRGAVEGRVEPLLAQGTALEACYAEHGRRGALGAAGWSKVVP